MTTAQFKEIEEYATARLRVGDVACAHLLLLIGEVKEARREIARLKYELDDYESELQFIDIEYTKANNSELTRDGLAVKCAALMQENERLKDVLRCPFHSDGAHHCCACGTSINWRESK